MSNEYSIALNKMRVAQRIFESIRTDYRARKIGDDEFLAARKTFKLAEDEFDKAFTVERDRP